MTATAITPFNFNNNDEFTKWVTSDVLLTIRKTGKYETPYSVHPHQSLSAEVAAMLRDLVSSYAKTLPKEQQADFIIKAWSKLTAHFGVSYRKIP